MTVDPDCIVIASRCGVVPVSKLPLTVAPEKLTLPKFASGRTPPLLDGASAITSADASLADFSRAFAVCVQPLVVSLIVNVKLPEPLVDTVADMRSPDATGLL